MNGWRLIWNAFYDVKAADPFHFSAALQKRVQSVRYSVIEISVLPGHVIPLIGDGDLLSMRSEFVAVAVVVVDDLQ